MPNLSSHGIKQKGYELIKRTFGSACKRKDWFSPKSTQARNLYSNNCALLAKDGCRFRSKFYTESLFRTCADTSSRPSSAFLPHPELEFCLNKECKREMNFLSLWQILFGDVHAREPAKTQMCDMVCNLIPKHKFQKITLVGHLK